MEMLPEHMVSMVSALHHEIQCATQELQEAILEAQRLRISGRILMEANGPDLQGHFVGPIKKELKPPIAFLLAKLRCLPGHYRAK
jgi:hypothetical protein